MLRVISLLSMMAICGGWSHGDAVCQPTIDGSWKNFVTDFGAVPNGVTDSSSAVTAWLTYAGANDGSKLYVPPGNYVLSDLIKDFGIGVNNMTVSGYGAIFNKMNIGPIAVLRQDLTHSARLQTTSVGATSVTLVTGSEISRFTVGQWILVAGLSMQNFGLPPNNNYNEFRQISAINGSTISFTTPLTFAYLSTWPEAGVAISWDLGGPATAYALRSDFAGTQKYFGMRVSQADQVTTGGSESIVICNMTFDGTGIAPSMSKSFVVKNTAVGSAVELDKAVEYLEFNQVTSAQINVQSSSITQFTIKNHSNVTALNGTAQNTTIEDSTIGTLIVGPTGYGHGVGLTATNSTITSTRLVSRAAIDASLVTFSGGTFSVPIADRDALISIAVPGQKYFFAFYNGTIFDHADGTGLVTSFMVTAIREDATKIYVDTDIGGTLPTPTFLGGNPANFYMAYGAATVTQTNSGPASLTQWQAP